MKKLLTLAVVLVALATFTGLSAAQERLKPGGGKPPPPAAVPPADKLTISATPNAISRKGCPVTVRLFWSGNPTVYYPGRTVQIVKVPPWGPPLIPPPPYVTTSKSEVDLTVPWNKVISAKELSFNLTSNQFACGEDPTSAK